MLLAGCSATEYVWATVRLAAAGAMSMATDADALGAPPMVVNVRENVGGTCDVAEIGPRGRPTADGAIVACTVEFIFGTDMH